MVRDTKAMAQLKQDNEIQGLSEIVEPVGIEIASQDEGINNAHPTQAGR